MQRRVVNILRLFTNVQVLNEMQDPGIRVHSDVSLTSQDDISEGRGSKRKSAPTGIFSLVIIRSG